MSAVVDHAVLNPTVTVDTTILRTSLVTVYITDNVTTPKTTQTIKPLVPTLVSSSLASNPDLTKLLPSVATYNTPTVTVSSTSSLSAIQPFATSSNSTAILNHHAQQAEKHAIISGLSGTIAGVVFIGLFICLYLRYRRRKHDSDESSLTEKSDRETSAASIVRVKALPATPSESSASVDEDHHIIRMNTRHWLRPFAFGEGYRDSMPPGQLRVTNPDSSRPSTSRKRSSDISSRFLGKQRSAFTGTDVVSNRSSGSLQPPPRAHNIPVIRIDRAHSPQNAAPSTVAPSLKSCMSTKTLTHIQQKPPEDPFLVPSSKPDKSPSWQIPMYNQSINSKASSKVTLSMVAGAVGRTLGYLSSILSPHSTHSAPTTGPVTNVRALSHFSVSTHSSRPSRRSDPFDLDRSSLTVPGRAASEFTRYGQTSNWILYEGT